jgi:hypothetical protein
VATLQQQHIQQPHVLLPALLQQPDAAGPSAAASDVDQEGDNMAREAHGAALADIMHELYIEEPGSPADEGNMGMPAEDVTRAPKPATTGMTISMIAERRSPSPCRS